jgi:osmotically-inducible protein OsmY
MDLPGFAARPFISFRRHGTAPLLALLLAVQFGGGSPRAQDRPEEGTPEAAPQTQTSPAEPVPPASPGEDAAAPALPPTPLPTDGEIQARLEEALSRDAGIAGHGAFRVKSEEGIVTITGSAETLSVLKQAERRAGDIRGVLDVVILCKISTAGAPDSQILMDIQQALDLPAFRGDNIAVAVVGGQVHLNGTTATYARKLLAERGASEAPGAVSVQNNLRVTAPPEGDDAALAWRIRLLLTGGLTPIPGRFDVSVSRREAILRGEVPLYSHRIQAERLALSVGGILGVQNRLKVNPSLDLPALPSRNLP